MCLSTGWANSSPLLCLSSSTGEEDYGVSDLRLVEKIVNLSIAAGLENPFPNYHVARPEDDTGEHFGVVQDGWQSSVNGPRERVTATEALTVHAGGLTAIDPSGSLQALRELPPILRPFRTASLAHVSMAKGNTLRVKELTIMPHSMIPYKGVSKDTTTLLRKPATLLSVVP